MKPTLIFLSLTILFLTIFNVSPTQAITNITACGTINTINEYYTLNTSLLAAGSCIVVGAENITIDGLRLYNLTSTNGTGNAIDATTSGVGWNVTVLNVKISNYSIDIATYGAANGAGSGFKGGDATVINSTLGKIYTYGGDGVSASSSTGGKGGNVVVLSSSVNRIDSNGGVGAGEITSSGGNSGNVSVVNSDLVIINAYGPSGGAGGGAGGRAGNVLLLNSNITNITAYGGSGTSTTGNGSIVSIISSSPVSIVNGIILIAGGTDWVTGETPGAGGFLSISSPSINLSGTNITNYRLDPGLSGTRRPGGLFLNYSSYFNDKNAIYGLNSSVRIINNSVGEILWLNTISTIGSTALNGKLSNNISILNSFASMDSNQISVLNVSANITFYSVPINFNRASLYRDGALCPTSICYNFTSVLSGGTVIFNVTGFSSYSVQDAVVNYTANNLVGALIFYSNSSLINYSFTGNFSVTNLTTVLVLDRYNVTKAVNVANDPFWNATSKLSNNTLNGVVQFSYYNFNRIFSNGTINGGMITNSQITFSPGSYCSMS